MIAPAAPNAAAGVGLVTPPRIEPSTAAIRMVKTIEVILAVSLTTGPRTPPRSSTQHE